MRDGERHATSRTSVLRIDCAECVLEGTDACADCVVTWLVDHDDQGVVVVDLSEVRALRALQHGGLVPELRHRRRPPSVAAEGFGGRARYGLAPRGPSDGPARRPRLRDELLRLGLDAGLDAVGVAAAEAWPDARRRLEERKAAGLARRHAVHLPRPGPGHRSRAGPCPTPRPSSSAPAPTAAHAARRRADRRGPTGAGGAPTPGSTTTSRCAPALKAVAGRLKADGWRARVLVDDNALVDREAAHRAGLGWFGKNANLLLPGRGSWFVLGAVRHLGAAAGRRRRRCADGCGAVPALPRRLPDRRHRRARAWSTPGAACRGCCRSTATSPASTGRRSATGSTAATTARRSARRTAGPTTRTRRRRPSPARSPRSTLLDLLAADDDDAARPPRRAGTCPGATPTTCAATPSWCSATSATAPTPAVVAALDRYLGHPQPDAAGPRGVGGPPARPRRPARRPRATTTPSPPSWPPAGARAAALMTHLLVTNDFPPKLGGIQSYLWELWRRLPPDDVTVLTTAARRRRGVGRRAAVPGRARPASRVLLPDAVAARGASTRWPTRSAPSSSCSTRPCPSARSGPRLRHALRRSCSTAPRSPCPAGSPAAGQLLGGVLRGRPAGRRRRRLPAGRGRAGRRARRCRPSSCRPASTSTGSARSTPTQRPAARRALRAARTTRRSCSGVSRLVPRKGFDALLAGRRPACAPTRPDLRGRHRRRRPRPAPARAAGRPTPARRSASSAGSPTTTCPPLYGCADVFAMLCRNRWGGLEQEGFGIVFLEAAAAGVPQVAGRSGGSHEAVVDGETGLRRRRRQAGAEAALGPAARRRRRCAAGDGRGRPGPGRGRVHLRRPRRPAGRGHRRVRRLRAVRRRATRPCAGDRRCDPVVRPSAAPRVFVVVAVAAAAAPDDLRRDPGRPSSTCVAVRRRASWPSCVAYARAVGRSRTEAIDIGGLFFLLGGDVAPPGRCARGCSALFGVQVVVALVTGVASGRTPRWPSASSCPMLGLGPRRAVGRPPRPVPAEGAGAAVRSRRPTRVIGQTRARMTDAASRRHTIDADRPASCGRCWSTSSATRPGPAT